MLIQKSGTKHVSTVTHEGKVVVMLTVTTGQGSELWYTVKQDGFEDAALKAGPAGTGWQDLQRLMLPADQVGDPSVEAKELDELTAADGSRLLRSVYSSASLTADAAVQLVSHDGHCYVFRQSTRGTILVDRFVLDGMNNVLTPKLEVRYKRSRQRYVPLKPSKVGSGGQLASQDSLDFRDVNGTSFVEPTTELCPNLITGVSDGGFGVVVTPTNEQDSYRWHVFVRGAGDGAVDVWSLRAGDAQMFDLSDSPFRTVDPKTDQAYYRTTPGLVRRHLTLRGPDDKPLTTSGGPTAVCYGVQHEQQTPNGPRLVDDTSRVLLAVPTSAGTAVLTFAIGADGRLAQIAAAATDTLQRSQSEEILLPLDVLDRIRAVGDSGPGRAGTIRRLARSDDPDHADRLELSTDSDGAEALGAIHAGDVVRLTKTKSLSGLHEVVSTQGESIVLEAAAVDGPIGHWEKVEDEATGHVVDGMLLSYAKVPDGQVWVRAVDHSLEPGGKVQITGDFDYDGDFGVLATADGSVVLDRPWSGGDALDVRLDARRRRGLVLDGQHDWVEASFSEPLNLTAGFTLEGWVKTSEGRPILSLLAGPGPANQPGVSLGLDCTKDPKSNTNSMSLRVWAPDGVSSVSAVDLPLNRWTHVAVTFDGTDLLLLRDGHVEYQLSALKLFSALFGRKETPSWRIGSLVLGSDVYRNAPIADRLGGQLSEVRLWRTPRTPAQVSDAMYQQLTGRETDLAGYWRLGGLVSADGAMQVVDFSVGANHGLVHGAPYIVGVTLDRTLGDARTATVRLTNDDFVAVRDGGHYVERFEFRTSPRLSSFADVDGKGTPIFVPLVWGQASRKSRERIDVVPEHPHFALESLADGWQAATCSYVVPDGMRVVRAFGVAEVAGSWESVEIRRHSLSLVSDTITLSTLMETATLAPLTDTSAGLRPVLVDLATAELKESTLASRIAELDGLLADTASAEALAKATRDRDTKRGEVKQKQDIASAAQTERDRAMADPLNFWCTFSTLEQSPRYLTIRDHGTNIINTSSAAGDRSRWRVDPLTSSPGYYKIINKVAMACADAEESGGVHQNTFDPNNNHQRWTLGRWTDGACLFTNQRYDQVLAAPGDDGMTVEKRDDRRFNQRWRLTIDGDAINDLPRSTQEAFDRATNAVVLASRELDPLEKAVTGGTGQRGGWTDERTTKKTELDRVQQQIAALTTTYLAAASAAQGAAQTMRAVGGADPDGLAVQGSLLPGVRPAGPVQLLDSCTGDVVLSYVDADGRVRQARYDAAYDSDGTGEQWLPETHPAALALSPGRPTLTIPPDGFTSIDKQVTVELWARGGSLLPKESFLLAANGADGTQRLRIRLPDASGNVVWEAGQSAGGATLDRLSTPATPAQWRGTWNHWAFVKDAEVGELRIHLNGAVLARTPVSTAAASRPHEAVGPLSTMTLGGLPGETSTWDGSVCELRIWDVALGEREIETGAVHRAGRQLPGLVAYYPMDEATGPARDHTGSGRTLNVATASWAACTAPFGHLADPTSPSTGPTAASTAGAAVVCTEFSRVRVDAQRTKSVMMNRCFALATPDGLRLLDNQRIDQLEMAWIGNAQINPTLVGYIEGAPPLPSENLTEDDDYNGATSVELIVSDDVEFSWTRDQDGSLGAEAEVLIGVKSETSVGVAVQTTVEENDDKAGGKLNFANHWQNSSTVSASQSLMSSDRLELRGRQEPDAHFPALGQRFVPKNIGYALVTSGLADVFVSKLRRSGRMVGFQVLPVDGVPLDVNTITFMINPAYTMAGSLDGLTGSQATSDRVFGNVPQMRSQYGSLYPASYFRLREAYDLKEQIDQQDKAHQAYFNQFVAGEVDETSLSRQEDEDNQVKPITVKSSLDQQVEDAQADLDTAKKTTPDDKTAIKDKEKTLNDLTAQQTKARHEAQKGHEDAAKDKEDKIKARYADLSARAHATDSFASWQTKMESLQLRAGKRNIVNTYVWDGDGGLHAEEQQYAGTVEHSVGGSFDLGASVGGQGKFAAFKAAVELSAYATMSLTQTMSKTTSSTKGLELHVDLDGVESRGITDFRDEPVLPGEKVDRYRFMSFYLESAAEHWHDFFDHVVDPEWLASNDEEARAVRQTAAMEPNKVWRVLHRVTYVERPALMGFGRSAAKPEKVDDELQSLRKQVDKLTDAVAALQHELGGKLSEVIESLPRERRR